MMISSHPANDLAVDVKVEHAAIVSCANTQLTALGKNGGMLKENANSEIRFEISWVYDYWQYNPIDNKYLHLSSNVSEKDIL